MTLEVPNLAGFTDALAIRYFSLGRYALTAGLKELSIGKGHVVLVPEFICRDLLASIQAVQAEPLFYPVDRALTPRALPTGKNVKAVLAVNYFGFPQEMAPFRAYCADYGAVLIEDNAHGYLSRDGQGNLLGSRGDLGILSLRKTFALPDGAALLVNRPEWLDRLPAPLSCCNNPLPTSFILKQALRQIQNTTGLRVRSLSERLTRYFRWIRTGQPLPISLPEAESIIPGRPSIHCESLNRLGRIDVINEVNRRRVLYQDFHQDLHDLNIESIFGDLMPGVAPYGYPFRADESDAKAVARIAQKRGFDCSRWPELPTAIVKRAPDFYKNVWWVNFLC